MYHPYIDGYSVLPNLKKLGDRPVFERSHDLPRYLDAKRAAVAERKCFFTDDVTEEILQTVARWMVEQYPTALDPPHDFENLLMQIQEDVLIQRVDSTPGKERNWAAAAHVCLPSSWDPADIIGKDFETIHQPVPGMDLRRSQKIAEAIVHQGPFERFQWGVFFEDRLDFHPSGPPRKKFDSADPFVVVKVERQITFGFPELNATAFVLRQHMLTEESIDKQALVHAVSEMSDAECAYKGITDCAPKLIDYLRQA